MPCARLIAAPFTAATGIPVQLESWDGGLDALRSQLKAPDNAWDLVEVNADELATGCGEGLFEKLDWSAIGGKDHYLAQGVSDCGVGAAITTMVLAWDRDKFPAAPGWADFWDVAKYPGKRGLYKGVRGNLEFALIADGVSPADVYKVLGTSDGRGSRVPQAGSAQAVYRVVADRGRGGAYPEFGRRADDDGAVRPDRRGRTGRASQFRHPVERRACIRWRAGRCVKGSPDLRQAQQFLYFAGMPAVQARLFDSAGIAGLAKGANDGLPPELQALSPTIAANLGAAVRIDTGFWHDNLAKLQQRFDTWLGAH